MPRTGVEYPHIVGDDISTAESCHEVNRCIFYGQIMRKQKDKYGAKGRFVYTDEQLDLLALSMVLPGARGPCDMVLTTWMRLSRTQSTLK